MIKPKEISNYLKQAGKNCPFSFRKKLTTDLTNNLSDYLDENPQSTIGDIINHFGSPETFADEYILAMDETSRKKAINKVRWIKRIVFISLAVIVLIIAVTAIWIICENSQTAAVYYSEGIIE